MEYGKMRIADLRVDHDLKQQDVANILGITRSRYSKYERGINDMPLPISNALANYYHVSFNYLYGISKQKQVPNNGKIDCSLLCIRLKELRKQKKLSRRELGEKVGFPGSTYAGYELGQNIPTTLRVYYIAIYYQVSLDYLVGRSDIKELPQNL